ncbi:MAG: 50S ribosomal protein L17 [bacterium]
MRHQKNKTKLDRGSAARKSLLITLTESLVLYEKIKTTKAKAKALRPFAEKIITKAKKGDLSARRQLIKSLHTENVVRKLMDEIGPRYKDREGGYTRVILLNNRLGDGAEEAIIEFV